MFEFRFMEGAIEHVLDAVMHLSRSLELMETMSIEVGMVTPVDEKACFGPSQSTARAKMHHQED